MEPFAPRSPARRPGTGPSAGAAPARPRSASLDRCNSFHYNWLHSNQAGHVSKPQVKGRSVRKKSQSAKSTALAIAPRGVFFGEQGFARETQEFESLRWLFRNSPQREDVLSRRRQSVAVTSRREIQDWTAGGWRSSGPHASSNISWKIAAIAAWADPNGRGGLVETSDWESIPLAVRARIVPRVYSARNCSRAFALTQKISASVAVGQESP